MRKVVGVGSGLLLLLGTASQGLTATTYTVLDEFQAGGHIMFDYTLDKGDLTPVTLEDTWYGIDVVNVWNVQMLEGSNGGSQILFTDTFTGLDVNGDGIPGLPMMDGPFVGFTASFNFDLTYDANANEWTGGGDLSMYDPAGNPMLGRNGEPLADNLKSSWNGEFDGFWYPNDPTDTTCVEGDTSCGHVGVGVYGLEQVNKNNFNFWYSNNITTYGVGSYSIETADANSPDAGTLDFTVPVPTAAVPEPAAMLLIGSGLAGLFGLSRKKR